jgi:segregation and condensation protein B
MSLKSKIEAVIYASEEPVTLQQLVGLLAGEAQSELDDIAAGQGSLLLDEEPQDGTRSVVEAGTQESPEGDTAEERAVDQGEVAGAEVEASSDANAEGETPSEEPGVPEASDEPVEPPADDAPSAEDTESAAETDIEAAAEPSAADTENDKRRQRDRDRGVRDHIRWVVDSLIREYAESDRGIEIREVASGFRMGTKPEYHDAVRGFVKSLKPALKLTLPALETLAVVAYKQPVTAAEISEIRGVDSAGVLGGLMTRKLIATAGRKQVIGRPMLYKTTRDFLLRFGLKDVQELPSMEEFERMAGELAEQEDLPMDGDNIIEEANARGDAEMIRDVNGEGDPAGDAETEEEAVAEAGVPEEIATPEASSEEMQDNQQATAEIAAGGNDEEQGSEEQAAIRAADEGGEDAGDEDARNEDTGNEGSEEVEEERA